MFGLRLITLQVVLYIVFHFASSAKLSSNSRSSAGGLIVDIRSMRSCNESWNQMIVTSFQQNVLGKYVRSYDMDVYFSSSLQKFTKGTVTMTVCKEAYSYNTCEHFATWRFGDTPCALFNDEHAFWSPLIKAFTPIFHCPMKEGRTYRLRNASADLKMLRALNLPLDGSVWKTKVSAANEERKEFGCVQSEWKALHVRQ